MLDSLEPAHTDLSRYLIFLTNHFFDSAKSRKLVRPTFSLRERFDKTSRSGATFKEVVRKSTRQSDFLAAIYFLTSTSLPACRVGEVP